MWIERDMSFYLMNEPNVYMANDHLKFRTNRSVAFPKNVARVVDGGVGGECPAQGIVAQGQQPVKGAFVGLDEPEIVIDGVAGDSQRPADFAVDETVPVQRDDLFDIHGIKCVCHFRLLDGKVIAA